MKFTISVLPAVLSVPTTEYNIGTDTDIEWMMPNDFFQYLCISRAEKNLHNIYVRYVQYSLKLICQKPKYRYRVTRFRKAPKYRNQMTSFQVPNPDKYRYYQRSTESHLWPLVSTITFFFHFPAVQKTVPENRKLEKQFKTSDVIHYQSLLTTAFRITHHPIGKTSPANLQIGDASVSHSNMTISLPL